MNVKTMNLYKIKTKKNNNEFGEVMVVANSLGDAEAIYNAAPPDLLYVVHSVTVVGTVLAEDTTVV